MKSFGLVKNVMSIVIFVNHQRVVRNVQKATSIVLFRRHVS